MRSLRVLASLSITASFALAACGDSPGNSDEAAATSVATTAEVSKPVVALPAELPTALVVTDLAVGTGPAAEAGDTVVVNYVGVLSATGEEFDSSYGGSPFEVSLGAGRVIAGWDQGLVGAQQGTRRQLDIPAELAYGDSPPVGGLIKAGDALTFVVDVVAVLPTSDVADQPQITLSPASNVAEVQATDLIVGDGLTVQDGQNVAIQILTFRADTGELLDSSWGGPPFTFPFSAQSPVFPGLLAAIKDMHVGGRRQAQIPFALMFDGQGSPDFGLPAEIDLVVVLDLVAAY